MMFCKSIRYISIISVVVFCFIISAAHASKTEAEFTATHKSAIASAHPLATQAGREILEAGGNAFDAAIAVAASLAVVEPYSSGLGGGGFFLLHRNKDGFETMIDARETAPLKASSDMYLDKQGNAISSASKNGPIAAGIPGIPAAFEHLAKKYGRLPLKESLAPAIRYAKEGFTVTERYRLLTGYRLKLLQQNPSAAAIFLQNGELPDAGFLVTQSDLADVFTVIAENGAKAFYQGDIAKKLVKGVNKQGGIWTLGDLESYTVIERPPVRGQYRDMQITGAALPSSGGIVLIDTLNILANYDLKRFDRAQQVHLIVEAMRRAYRDRAEFLGDSDFVDVPVDRLIHPYYASGQAASIRLDKATASTALPGAAVNPVGDDTTHFSIIDSEGNRVAATLSINFPFGCGYVAPGTGILLNNEMDDFAAKAGVPNGYGLVAGADNPNSIQPGKRMLSSMSPTFVETKGRIAVIGTPGGSRIISMVLQAVLQFHDGASAETIVATPRFHHQFLPDQIMYEPGTFVVDTQRELQLRGHQLREHERPYGNMQVVIFDKQTSDLHAASDPRGEGSALVWSQ